MPWCCCGCECGIKCAACDDSSDCMVKEITVSVPPLLDNLCTNCANTSGTYVTVYNGIGCETEVTRTTGSMPTNKNGVTCNTANSVHIRIAVETHDGSSVRMLGYIKTTHTASGCTEIFNYSSVHFGTNTYTTKDCSDNAFDGIRLRYLNTGTMNCTSFGFQACRGNVDAFDALPHAQTKIIVSATACEPA
jgi:hypothetical protein